MYIIMLSASMINYILYYINKTCVNNQTCIIITNTTRGEAIMLVKLSIILFSNSHNFTYYAHRLYLLFSKLCLV